ncbi:MAG TPA: dihydrolipoyl dehydrogenase [Limnochordales bacterium]
MADQETGVRALDLVVLGGGPGGYVAAIRAAQLGMRVALVEKDRLGGVCLNRGCIPTKAMVKTAEALTLLRRAEQLGVRTGDVALDYGAVVRRRQQVVETLVRGVEQLMRANRIEVLAGEGRVAPDGRVEVALAGGGTTVVTAPRLILATGSQPVRLPIPGTELPGVVDSDGLLALEALPPRLVVIGAGIVGCEFASIFRAFGSEVSLLELLPAVLPVADGEISRRLALSLRRAGIRLFTGARVEAIEAVGPDGPWGPVKRVRFTDAANQTSYAEGEVVLVSVGRRPAFTGFRPDELGLELVRGAIKVDEQMQTSRPGFYAIGDVNGLAQLAHAASAQGIVAAQHAAGRPGRPWGTSPVPSAVFTLPEVAWVGLTEEQARAQGLEVQVGRFTYGALGRAHVEMETDGFVKILARAQPPGRGEVVGLHILGRGATELVHEGVLAMRFGATAEELAEAIHAHPTLSEAVAEAAHALTGHPIHMARA